MKLFYHQVQYSLFGLVFLVKFFWRLADLLNFFLQLLLWMNRADNGKAAATRAESAFKTQQFTAHVNSRASSSAYVGEHLWPNYYQWYNLTCSWIPDSVIDYFMLFDHFFCVAWSSLLKSLLPLSSLPDCLTQHRWCYYCLGDVLLDVGGTADWIWETRVRVV